MKRIYITIGSRVEHEGDKPEDKGEFLAIDWETKNVIGFYTADSFEKVRIGRSRGASGLAWHDDKLYLTCRHRLMSIDPDNYEESSRAESKHGGFHGIASDGNTLWVTAHGADTLIGIRNDKVMEEISTRTLSEEEACTQGLKHANGLNAVGFSPEGEMFLMYSHKGWIYNWTKQEIAIEMESIDAPHDICFMDSENVLYTKSAKRQMWKGNILTGEEQQVFELPPNTLKPQSGYAMTGWLRGIAHHSPSNTAFVMAAPGTIYELDSSNWALRDSYVFETKKDANPFAIVLDPRDWV